MSFTNINNSSRSNNNTTVLIIIQDRFLTLNFSNTPNSQPSLAGSTDIQFSCHIEFFCSPNICRSKYDTRIQAQADNTGNEPRNLQRKKLLTVNNLILSSKLMSASMFISVNCSNEYGIRQLKC